MLKKVVSVFACVALVAMGLCALGSEEQRVVVDMKGREIHISAAAKRVVVLAPADCEIVYALGAQDVLVGRGIGCNYPQNALALPVVNSWETTNIEQIIALEPEFVLMNTMAQTLEQVNALEAAGIQVVATDTTDIEGVYRAITLIGALCAREEEAENIISGMKATFEEIMEKSESISGKTIYFEVSPLEYGLWTAGTGTFFHELAEICGLENIFSDIDGWAEISQEQVIARNPDYIATIFAGNGGEKTPQEEIKTRAGWESIQAVEGDKVLQLDADEASRPGPRLMLAARHLFDFMQEP